MIVKKEKIFNLLLIVFAVLFILFGLWGVYYFISKGIKPECLQLRVFTLASKYIELKTFTSISNNQGDELSVMSYCLGWILVFRVLKRTFHNWQTLALFVFACGYSLLHGTLVIYFIVLYLLITPIIWILFEHRNNQNIDDLTNTVSD